MATWLQNHGDAYHWKERRHQCWQACGIIKRPYIVGNENGITKVEDSMEFSPKLKIELPYDLVIPFLGMTHTYVRTHTFSLPHTAEIDRLTDWLTEISTAMFTAALLKIIATQVLLYSTFPFTGRHALLIWKLRVRKLTFVRSIRAEKQAKESLLWDPLQGRVIPWLIVNWDSPYYWQKLSIIKRIYSWQNWGLKTEWELLQKTSKTGLLIWRQDQKTTH